MEQTRLFQCNRFHYADFVIEIVSEIVIEIDKPCSTMQKIVIEIVIEFFRTSSARSEKF